MGKKHVLKLIGWGDFFCIKWRITQMCNYHCSYCLQEFMREGYDKARLLEQEEALKETAKKISRMIEREKMKNVKLEFVGGEASLFNLRAILENITAKNVVRVQLTTNLSQSASFYNDLALYLKGRGISMTMTASFHFEHTDIDTYFAKARSIRDNVAIFTCEMVSMEANQSQVQAFIARCDEYGFDYLVDKDFRFCARRAREKNLFISGARRTRTHPRFTCVFERDGVRFTEEYKTRNSFMTDGDVQENLYRKTFLSKGYYCSTSYNSMYIEQHRAVGRTKDCDDCHTRMDIDDFRVLPPRPCVHERCSLCGYISLFAPEVITEETF